MNELNAALKIEVARIAARLEFARRAGLREEKFLVNGLAGKSGLRASFKGLPTNEKFAKAVQKRLIELKGTEVNVYTAAGKPKLPNVYIPANLTVELVGCLLYVSWTKDTRKQICSRGGQYINR